MSTFLYTFLTSLYVHLITVSAETSDKKVTVKFALQQATKAQSGSRGIPLLLL